MIRSINRFRNFVSDVISGVGTDDDPGSRFELNTQKENYSVSEIIAAYTTSGQLQRSIDLIPTAAMGFIFKDKQTKKKISISQPIEDKLEQLKIRDLFCQASISARLFRESYLMLVTANDNYEEPLAENEEILELLPLEVGQVTFVESLNDRQYRLSIVNTTTDIYRNTVQRYTLNTVNAPIHPSRLLAFVGKYYPPMIRGQYGGYHGNAIGGLLTSYGYYRHTLNLSKSLLARMATFIIKLAGYQQWVEGNDSQGLSNRLSMLKRFIGSMGGFLLDAESEDVSWLQLNLSGISEVVQLHAKQYSAESELNHGEFWNDGSTDTTSAYEETNFNKRVEQFLQMYWQSNFNHLYYHLTRTTSYPMLGMEGVTSTNVQEQQQQSSNEVTENNQENSV
jgi:hypothetical protein